MYNIGILYICTGKYIVFWEDFYISSELYLLPKCRKTYYVFTDAAHIANENNPHVIKIQQNNLGWPGGTLMRFEMFRSIEHLLKKTDYLFFFNSDLQFVDFVREDEILPDKEQLTALIHPYFYNKSNTTFPYERNPHSMAFIPPGQGTNYYFGSLYGGKTRDFLNMAVHLEESVHNDLSNGIMAVWYDESYLNKYLHMLNNVKALPPSYGYPEGELYPFVPKILKRNKGYWGGHQLFRGI